MSKFDTEVLFKTLTTILKDNLNTQIGLINTEKNDFDINDINDDAWYIDELPKTFSYSSFVFYGISSSNTNDVTEEATLRQISIDYEIIIPDGGSSLTENNYYKLLRYSRALEDSFQKNVSKIPSYVKVVVDSLLPVKLRVKNRTLDSVGIKVTASLTSN